MACCPPRTVRCAIVTRVSEVPVDLDRRAVLSAIVSWVGLACAPKVGSPAPQPPLPLVEVLAAVPRGVRVVGRRYLAAHPEDADADGLRDRLGWPRSGGSAAQWHARLDHAVRDDLEGDRIAEIGGWHLTRTECRVYALAALLEGPA